jgi:transcriptional regulator with XRE-family HTH domain
MAGNEFLGDRRRENEEGYFQRREQELIANLQQRARDDVSRREMAERTGVVDHETLQELEALGFTPDTVMLIHLVPLVHVAWAEGGISEQERRLIIEAARSTGIQAESDADRQLAAWLLAPPPDEFFERALRVIGLVLQARPHEECEVGRFDLLSYCRAIASASGGIVGFRKVSGEEARVLSHIGDELGRAHRS